MAGSAVARRSLEYSIGMTRLARQIPVLSGERGFGRQVIELGALLGREGHGQQNHGEEDRERNSRTRAAPPGGVQGRDLTTCWFGSVHAAIASASWRSPPRKASCGYRPSC